MTDLTDFTQEDAEVMEDFGDITSRLADRVQEILQEEYKDDGGTPVTSLGDDYEISWNSRWVYVDFDAANGNLMRHTSEDLNMLKEYIPKVDKVIVDFANQVLKIGFRRSDDRERSFD